MRPLTPPADKISTPEHPDVSPVAPEIVQSVATATAIETAKATSAATPEVGTSASKPAPWTEHVSVFCRVRIRYLLCITYAGFMCLLPYYLNLVESGEAFVQMEQERDSLRANLEQLTRKCSLPLHSKVFVVVLVFELCLAIVFR